MKTIAKPSLLVSFLLLVIIFGYFSFNAPYMTDNYIFSLDIKPGYAQFYTGKQVDASAMTWAAAFRQACEMYTSWCGRFMGNLAVYLLFLLPPAIWHIVSSVAFGGYVLMLHISVFGRQWKRHLTPGWILALGALLWISIPSFGEAFFWLSVGGQIALLTQAAMLLPYRLALDAQTPDQECSTPTKPILNASLAFLFFLAGVGTASLDYPTSAALPPTALCVVIYLYFISGKRKIQWLLLLGALGLFLGSALTLTAPGNGQRLLLTHDSLIHQWLESSWPERILQWFFHLPLLLPMLFAPFILLGWDAVCLWKSPGRNFLKKIPIPALLYLLPFCLTIGAYLFTAWPPPRAFATCSVQLLLGALIIFARYSQFATVPLAKCMRFLRGCMAFYCVVTVIIEAYDFHELHRISQIREKIILSSDDGDIVLPPIPNSANRYQVLGGELADIAEDPDYWVNRAMAIYYGVKSGRKHASLKIRRAGPFIQYKDETAGTSCKSPGQIRLDRQRFNFQTEEASRALLENGVHIYYYGRPALLAKIWTPLGEYIYKWLANGKKGALRQYLVPLLMARTDLHRSESPERPYSSSSPIINLINPSAIWLVEPGESIYSFNLLPYREAGSSSNM